MLHSRKSKMTKAIKAVSVLHGQSIERLTSTSRKKELVDARKMFTYYVRKTWSIPYHDIRKFLKLKDHTTILHYFRMIDETPEMDFEEIERIKVEVRLIDRFVQSGSIQPLCNIKAKKIMLV